jgi:bifunctional non-homologous end joining protein LigD
VSEIEVEGVRLTSPDKILYPEQGITKGELADYYRRSRPICCRMSRGGR